MKATKSINQKTSALLLAGLLAAGPVSLLSASTSIYKTDTATMNTTNDWTAATGGAGGDVAPGFGETGVLDSTISATNAASLTLGGNVSLDGITFSTIPNVNGPVTISSPGGYTLTLGSSTNSSGVTMTASTNAVTINCNVSLNQSQNWNLSSLATLNINGMLSSGSAGSGITTSLGTVNLNGGGAVGGGTGTYFSVRQGALNINSNLTITPAFRMSVGWGNNPVGILNISNATLMFGNSTEVDIGGGYNGTQTTGSGIINIGGTNGALGKFDLGQTTGTFKIGVISTAAGYGTLNLNDYGTLSTRRSLTANTLAGSGIINFNGGTLQLSGPQSTAIGTGMVVNILDDGATIDTQTNSTSILPAVLSGGTGIGGLTKLGTGTLTFGSVPVSWGGPTVINGGELMVSTLGFNNSNSVVTVAAYATNGVQKVTGGATWTIAGLNFAAGSTYLDLAFNATPGLVTAPITVNGSVAINGTLGIIVRGTALWAPGQYPLIKYTGTLSGTVPSSALQLPSGVVATIVNNTNNQSIDLAVTVGNGAPTQTISWGVGSGTWDINTTPNWLNSDGGLVDYQDGEIVQFTDGAPGPSPIYVELDSTVDPAGVIANNSTMNYTIQGSGSITGTNSLTKSGTGTLQMNLYGGNTYSGGTYLTGGTLQISADDNLGATNGPLVMGSTLGATFYSSGADVGMMRPFIITSNATITIDPGTTLSLTNDFDVSRGAGTVNVNGGGTLDFPAGTATITNGYVFQCNNATVQLDGGTLNSYSKFVVGNSPNAVATFNINSGTFNQTYTYNITTNISYTTNGIDVTTNIVVGTNYISGFFGMADSENVYSTLNLNGGAMNILTAGGDQVILGDKTSAVINVNGGSLHINSDPLIYLGGHPTYGITGGSGTLNITGPGTVTVDASSQIFTLGVLAPGATVSTGTINLIAGGTLTTGRPIVGGNGTSYLNFSGGTLKAGTNSPNFLQNLTAAGIDANGATIDDGGFAVTIAQPLVDNGGGYLTKSGNGTLYLDGTNAYYGPTIVTDGALGGSGSVAGDLTVSNGASLAPGDAGTIGTLTVGGNFTLGGNVLVGLNTSLAQSCDALAVTGTLTNGGSGAVLVTNLGPALAVGNRFVLFNQPLPNGGALTVTGGGATWKNNLAVDGSISVLTVVPTVNTNSFAISSSVSGGHLNLAWPPDHLGWTLWVQTNSLSIGLGTNWSLWPNSTTMTNVSILINPTNPGVFYRMTYP